VNSKTTATTAIFAALTVALNLGPFKIPAPYATFLYYQIWEIPIVTAFLVIGPWIGAAVAVMNTAALLVLFPGALPTGPIYNLTAVFSMFLGIYLAHWLTVRRPGAPNEAVLTSSSTALGIITRVATMTFVNWAFLGYPPPVGFSLPKEAVMAMLPLVGFFNATLVLYTVPTGYILARAVASATNARMWTPKT